MAKRKGSQVRKRRPGALTTRGINKKPAVRKPNVTGLCDGCGWRSLAYKLGTYVAKQEKARWKVGDDYNEEAQGLLIELNEGSK